MNYRVRLRFRIGQGLNVPGKKTTFQFQERDVDLSSQEGETLLQDAEWVVMNARSLPSAEEAMRFGKQLKAAVLVAATCCRFGVDLGKDKPTQQWGAAYKAARKEHHGEIHRDNVHGLDVFEDHPATRFTFLRIKGQALADGAALLSEVTRLSGRLGDLPRTQVPLRLLNSAIFATDPLGKLVLAIASVEMLIGKRSWSSAQLAHLKEAASRARQDASLSADERQAVAEAIERSYTPGVNEGIRQLLAELNLPSSVLADWKSVYKPRSQVFHGKVAADDLELSPLANEAVRICGRIVLSAAVREGADISDLIDKYYPPT